MTRTIFVRHGKLNVVLLQLCAQLCSESGVRPYICA